MANRTLDPTELRDLRRIADQFAKKEPDNGFWLQVGAAFAVDGHDYPAARSQWIKASKGLTWNDHETSLLLENLPGISSVPGSIFASAIDLRREAVVDHLQRTADALLRLNWNDPQWSMQVKAATVLNGDLIRSHARTLRGMNTGIRIVDSALVRPGAPNPAGHHQLLVARLDLARDVQRASIDLAGRDLDHVFSECDSAVALTTREDTLAKRQNLSITASIVEVLPGAALFSGTVSLVALLLRTVFQGVALVDERMPWLGTLFTACFALLLTYKFVPNFVALSFALCIIFRGSTPSNVRRARPKDLGRLHSTFIVFTALMLVATVSAGLLFVNPISGPRLRMVLPIAFDWQASFFGLIELLFGGLLLTAPLWAFAQRLPSQYVLDLGLGRLVRVSGLIALTLAVASGPICLMIERNVQPQVSQIFMNEPIYYLAR